MNDIKQIPRVDIIFQTNPLFYFCLHLTLDLMKLKPLRTPNDIQSCGSSH